MRLSSSSLLVSGALGTIYLNPSSSFTTARTIDSQVFWSDCGYRQQEQQPSTTTTHLRCGQLEFCENISHATVGYRLPGDTLCTSPGPTLRLVAGTTYFLTLINSAEATPINLHAHGLHISGDGNADDPRREAQPGECLRYNWTIPIEHLGGTFWYHAHTRFLTNDQVSRGAYGLIIVEDADGPAAVAPPGESGIATWLEKNDDIELVATKVLGQETTGNGIVGGDVAQLIANEWYRLRVALVDPLGLSLFLEIAQGCEALAVAYDGVWRSSVPAPSTDGLFTASGASRLDLALKCNESSVILLADSPVLWLDVIEGNTTQASPFTAAGGTWMPNRPHYLRDLRSAAVDATFDIQISRRDINGLSYDVTTPLHTIKYDTVQEWIIRGDARHPFHLHVFHVQVVSPGGCGDSHEFGEYYDTIYAPGIDCVIRFYVIDYGERVMMHCHYLLHEDGGAMAWVNVTQGDGASMPLQADTNSASASCDTFKADM